MKKPTTMFDFFKRKYSNSSEVNVGLPTTNLAIPISKNVDVPILENIHSPIPENVNVPIPKNIHFPILDDFILIVFRIFFFLLVDDCILIY